MRWADNIISALNTGNAGVCPYCGSANTDFNLEVIIEEEKLGFGTIWCNDCKHAINLSRIRIKNQKPTKTPKNLIYS